MFYALPLMTSASFCQRSRLSFKLFVFLLPACLTKSQKSIRLKYISLSFAKFAENLNRDVNLFPGANVPKNTRKDFCFMKHVNSIYSLDATKY